MLMRDATLADYDTVFAFVEALWTYNTYDREALRPVYEQVLADPQSFACLLVDDDGQALGFCHGSFFNTFWLSGQICYLSSLIVREEARGKGYGRVLMDHVRALAKERGAKGIVLDSGLPRTAAHGFYEHYGFDKSCYGFDYLLEQ
ncbi:MAG: GNAT family N-acetyltransferase [Peptococcaceae bacterium]|nr:GNAT family N-acetyltransferase [Peptococcaceae bacterium]